MNPPPLRNEKPSSRRMPRGVKIGLIAVGSVIAAVNLGIAILAAIPDSKPRDYPALTPIWDPDLNDNPLALFERRTIGIREIDTEDAKTLIEESSLSESDIREFLSLHESLLQALDELAAKVEQPWQWDDMDARARIDSVSISARPITDSANLAMLRIRLLLLEGKEKQALQRAVELTKVGEAMRDARGGLIQFLVGLSVRDLGLGEIENLIVESRVASDDLGFLITFLEEMSSSQSGFVFATKTEFLVVSRLYEDLRSGKFEGMGEHKTGGIFTPFFHPNDTIAIHAKCSSAIISGVDQSLSSYSMSELIGCEEEAVLQWQKSIPISYLHPNPIGRILSFMSVPAYGPIYLRSAESDARTELLRAAIALEQYRLTTGTRPKKLSDLVPEFLETIPTDPFDQSKPLRYQPEDGLIYSIGKNFADNGGQLGKEFRREERDLGLKFQ